MSQPSVTTAVRRLERDLGERLFERGRPVRLTAFGTDMRPLLEGLQSAADRLNAALAQRRRAAVEQIRLSR